VADEINIVFGGDASQLERELEKAKQAVSKLQKSVKKSGDQIHDSFAKLGKRAVKELTSATKTLQSEFKSVENAAGFAGNVVGVIAEIDKLGSSIAGLRGETKRYNAAQTEINDTFAATASELAQYIDATSIIEDFSVGIAASMAGAGAFVSSLTDEFVLMFDTAKLVLKSIPDMARVVSDSFDGLNTDFEALDKSLLAVMSDMGGAELKKLHDDSLEAGGAIGKAATAAREAAAALLSARGAAEETAPAVEKLVSSADGVDEWAKSLAKLSGLEFGADQKSLEGVEKISAAYAKQFQKVYDLQQLLEKLARTEEDRGVVSEQVSATIEALHDAEAADKQKVIDKEEAALEKQVARKIKAEEDIVAGIVSAQEAKDAEEVARLEKHETDLADLRATTAAAVGDAFGKTSDLIGDMLKNSEGKTKKQMRTLFGLQKASSIAQTTIAGVQAAMMALATPPGPPFTFPLAAVVGGMAAANVATIAAQAPPFHIGSRAADLAPDEMRITRREGLAVLSPQGIQSGGAEAVANANAGMTSSGSQTMVFQYQHQMFDATIEDNLKRPNSPLGSVLRSSSYGHRRRNG